MTPRRAHPYSAAFGRTPTQGVAAGRTRPRRAGAARCALALAATGALLAAAACSGSSSHPHASASPSSPAPSSSASSRPAVHNTVALNPLTGVGPVPRNPVIVVKIDDTAPGRPQVGIDKADIVYLEAAEAGLTRLAALFSTQLPTVGYIRSTRPSDPELLRQYGRITEVYSGGQKVSRDILAAAGLHGYSYGAGAPGFYRVNRPESTYINVELDLAKAAKKIHTTGPRSNGWTFSDGFGGVPTLPGARMTTVVTGSYSIGTAVEFVYNRSLGRYVRYIDGEPQHAADGHLVTATNVVVQSCRVYSFYRDRDVNGNPAQFTVTVGSGPLAVFRGGRRVNGEWSRRSATSGTSLHTSSGRTIPLHPGTTWVVLVRNGIAVHG